MESEPCLVKANEPPVRHVDWNDMMQGVYRVGCSPPDEPYHLFPEMMHDTIRQLQQQRHSAIIADRVMKNFAKSTEATDNAMQTLNRMLMRHLLGDVTTKKSSRQQ